MMRVNGSNFSDVLDDKNSKELSPTEYMMRY